MDLSRGVNFVFTRKTLIFLALGSCDRASRAKCEERETIALGSCDRASRAKCEERKTIALGSCERASRAKCEERKTNKMQ